MIPVTERNRCRFRSDDRSPRRVAHSSWEPKIPRYELQSTKTKTTGSSRWPSQTGTRTHNELTGRPLQVVRTCPGAPVLEVGLLEVGGEAGVADEGRRALTLHHHILHQLEELVLHLLHVEAHLSRLNMLQVRELVIFFRDLHLRLETLMNQSANNKLAMVFPSSQRR